MNGWKALQTLKIYRILQVMLLISALVPLITIIVTADPYLLETEFFNHAMVVGILTALLVSWLLSMLLDVLSGKVIKRIKDFCEHVKNGEYEGFSNLPNQGWDNSDENEVLTLMREMNWMAHLIKSREKELQQIISQLKVTQDELEAKNDCLLEMAMTDPLTNLYNRRHFFEHLELEYTRLHRNTCSLALLMLDIDHFKKINDTFGHQIGDTVLVEFSAIVKQALRKRDLCARVGGEEFAVLLPDTERKEALHIACRIRRRIQEHLFHDDEGNTFYITCSVGAVVEKNSLFTDVDELWKHVDMALYAAKETGRNRICCCDEMGIKGITEEELIQ